ncbi:MAG TPA: hypothetical protein VFL29_05105 [Candidatus Dormibacteraeota bacterium]|nr:hypothetical protein [Candidatus Dormibacteraeota bacterium]
MAKRDLAELRIPASSTFIPVAKRVASTLGSQLGLSLTDLDELSIALTQACDSAINAADDIGGEHDLKLTYFATDRALVVDVDLLPAQHQAARHPAEAVAKHHELVDAEMQRLAYEMIRCFVDDFRPSIEPRTGQVRFRMVKHLAG